MESGLCSSGSRFHAFSGKFVCVRLYYTLRGASEPFAKLGLGDPRGPRNNVDLAFLTPDGRNLNVRTLKPAAAPLEDGIWVRDVVSREKNEAGDGKEILAKTMELMESISRLYPAKRDVQAVPWQVSPGHAIFVSAWDGERGHPRRILVVPAPGGEVDRGLRQALEDPAVLRRVEPHYVFLKLDPAAAPAELMEALGRGVILLDHARTANGFGREQAKSNAAPTWPKFLETRGGPFTKASVLALLEKHVAAAKRR